MKGHRKTALDRQPVSRRRFFEIGGAVAASSLSLSCGHTAKLVTEQPRTEPLKTGEDPPGIRQYRTLGRTGFEVSDISLGCGRISEPNVVRYAYDHGINYFDTAETYGNGDSETKIGQAMEYMDRRKIFITTKLWVVPETTEQDILDRFAKCLERMQTDHADALFLHGVGDASIVKHEGFHAAVAKLKQEGRLKHAGISSHGPDDEEPDSMEKVLLAAIEDGRFDLMLLVYSFMNHEEGERILAACKEKNIGTTAMKVTPGVLEVLPFDPDNPSEEYAGYLDHLVNEREMSREDAVARIQVWVSNQEENLKKSKPFVEKHGLKTEEQLHARSIQWVLQNPDMHTICLSLPDFDLLDRYLPLSGTKLTQADLEFLEDYRYAYRNHYCRHGCNQCIAHCPEHLPVSTIMRYSYYYTLHGREKYAMSRYVRLRERNGSLCFGCHAPCGGACPHGLDIQASLIKAHTLLTLA